MGEPAAMPIYCAPAWAFSEASSLDFPVRFAFLLGRRVAMLAVAGILLVEASGRGPWWTAPFRVG